FLVATLLALTAGASSANTPLVAVGASDDPWERRQYVQPDDCVGISDQQVFAPEQRQMASAVHRLQRTSLRALSDREVGQLLGVDSNGQYPELARQLLSNRISALSEERQHVFDEHRGAWSRAEDQNLDALRARLDGFHERPLAFYLV